MLIDKYFAAADVKYYSCSNYIQTGSVEDYCEFIEVQFFALHVSLADFGFGVTPFAARPSAQ